jgi:hypothetical protein
MSGPARLLLMSWLAISAGCAQPLTAQRPAWVAVANQRTSDRAFQKRLEKDSFPTPQQAGVLAARADSTGSGKK